VWPAFYLDDLSEGVGKIDKDIILMKELGILVERGEEGNLIQLFSMRCKPGHPF
jgi:4-hydroxyphenylpyruvate dioxygenase-like putative hemolysin